MMATNFNQAVREGKVFIQVPSKDFDELVTNGVSAIWIENELIKFSGFYNEELKAGAEDEIFISRSVKYPRNLCLAQNEDGDHVETPNAVYFDLENSEHYEWPVTANFPHAKFTLLDEKGDSLGSGIAFHYNDLSFEKTELYSSTV